jgi:hypothetical protein
MHLGFTGNGSPYELLWQAHFKMDKTPKKTLQRQLLFPSSEQQNYLNSHDPRGTGF